MKKVWILLALLGSISTTAAQDVTTDRSYAYFGLRGGVMMVDTIDYDEEFSFGVMAGFRFNEAMAVEISADNHFNGLFGTGWSTDAYQASLLLYLPVSRQVEPYFVGGIGIYQSSYNYWVYDGYDPYVVSEVDFTDGGFHAGAGVDIHVSPYVAISFDARYIFVDEDDSYDGEQNDGFLTTVGVKFTF